MESNKFNSNLSKIKQVVERGETIFSSVLIFFLASFPLILRFIQSVCKVQILDSDVAIINFVFLFACLAGFITWHKNRHLSLASLSDYLPNKAQSVINAIKTLMTSCVLTFLFFVSLRECLSENYDKLIWHIPLRAFFSFLPLCYFLINSYNLLLYIKERDKVKALFFSIGLVLGVFISSSSIAACLYYIFKITPPQFLYSINDLWMSFASFATLPLILILILCAFMGVPLFLILSAVSYILFSRNGGYVFTIPQETYRILTERNTAAIPLFTIAGYILSQGSAGKRYVRLFKALLGSIRGGVVIASVLVLTIFSTFTGVSGVTILALGSLLCLALTGSGYEKDKAESLVTASGAIGLLFPPSAAVIMYATVNYFYGIDVIELFKGAVLPGLLMMTGMIVLGIIYDRQRVRVKFSPLELLHAFLSCIPELLMPLSMCFFYFKGIFDLFETAAFAVVYAYILSTFIRRDYTFLSSCKVIFNSVPVFGGVIFILGAASGISFFILDADVPNLLTEFIKQYVSNKVLFLLLMNVVLLFVGCIMDMFSAILIVSPLLLPLAQSFGVPNTQAAVIFLLNLSIGFLTPPVGMDLFISSYTFNKPLGRVIKGITPFLIVQFIVLLLVTYIPALTSLIK